MNLFVKDIFFNYNLQDESEIKFKDNELKFFLSLKDRLDTPIYKKLIKLLFLFLTGVFNNDEFNNFSKKLLVNDSETYQFLKFFTSIKSNKRKNISYLNKPLSEFIFQNTSKFFIFLILLDHTLNVSYYTYNNRHYRNAQCSGRKENKLCHLFNDFLITIPNGSEDDKTFVKKSGYEESLYKFEDIMIEIDIFLQELKLSYKELKSITENLKKDTKICLSKNFKNVMKKIYENYSKDMISTLIASPSSLASTIEERLIKKIDEIQTKKNEQEKELKGNIEKNYNKSNDFKSSMKLKEKRFYNLKQFVKEIQNKYIEKYYTFVDDFNSNNNQENFKKSFCFDENYHKRENPDLIFSFENENALSLTVYVIFYYLCFSNLNDKNEIIDNLIFFFEDIVNFKDIEKMMKLSFNMFFTNNVNPKEYSYKCNFNHNFNLNNQNYKQEIECLVNNCYKLIDRIKIMKDEKEILDNLKSEKISKLIPIDELFNEKSDKKVNKKDDISTDSKHSYNNLIKKSLNSKISSHQASYNGRGSNISSDFTLTPSLQSNIENSGFNQKGFKKMSFNVLEKNKKEEEKEKNSVFYSNENFFLILKFVSLIYEKALKIVEIKAEEKKNYTVVKGEDGLMKIVDLNSKSKENAQSMLFINVFKFLYLFKILLHKSLENNNNYDDYCKDVLGDNSCILFGLDKLILSVSF